MAQKQKSPQWGAFSLPGSPGVEYRGVKNPLYLQRVPRKLKGILGALNRPRFAECGNCVQVAGGQMAPLDPGWALCGFLGHSDGDA